MEPLLRCVNLSKQFGSLPALQQISFAAVPGEVVGLAGWTGAGKSVLVMLLAGLAVPTDGELYIGGQRVRWPFRARALGIEVIHQQPDLAERLDITGNIFLGREIGWPAATGWLSVPNRRRMDQRAREILDQLDVRFPSLRERVSNVSGEQRQLIAIARTLVSPARLVIVDEPTAQLGYVYQQKLLMLIQRWQQQGSRSSSAATTWTTCLPSPIGSSCCGRGGWWRTMPPTRPAAKPSSRHWWARPNARS